MSERDLHVVHLLIRSRRDDGVAFLVYPHDRWLHPSGQPYLTLPARKTVSEPFAPLLRGTSLEHFVDALLRDELGLAADDYALEQEVEPAEVEMASPSHGQMTRYTIYPVDVWVSPHRHDKLCAGVRGQWLACQDGAEHERVSPTAAAVFRHLLRREVALAERYSGHPEEEQRPQAPRRLLGGVPERPTMDALARRWLSGNRGGVRHLPRQALDDILAAGRRAFNLRVADPYLHYQMQGLGFTWSFFTHKDPQDVHVHGAPVVEIYGVLKGRLEVWWKPYHDRGTSAWSHRVVEEGDWLEVDSLQCHIVHWLTEGMGVVFKAGPGPLAEVGPLGVKGKTPCAGCPCLKPRPVAELERGQVR